MQIIVLGMHRSGTSAVARLLNMMGAYFASENTAMPPADQNPKGFWEREDIIQLNNYIISTLGMSWDNLSDFNSTLLTPEVQKRLEVQAQKIILNLEAHRPWMAKDPRFCLLLPLWRPLLEIPVCVYVYRRPIQVAQSQKKRNDFPLLLSIALWEKYNLCGLAHSANIPRILVSHQALMTHPVTTVKKLYQALIDYEVQGLRLPSDKEIQAFIEPKLFHEQGDISLQNAYINHQQSALVEAFENETVFQLNPLPSLSAGATEILQEYNDKLHKRQEFIMLRQEVGKRDQEIINLDQELGQRDAELSQRHEEIAQYQRDISQQNEKMAQKNGEINRLNEEINRLNEEMNRLNEEMNGLNNQIQILKQSKQREHTHYNAQITHYRHELLTLETETNALKQEINELQNQFDAIQNNCQVTLTAKEQQLAEKESAIQNLTTKTQKQDQNIHQLSHWIRALNEDIEAIFRSLTWRSGQIITQITLTLMFKRAGLTAQDHIQSLRKEIEAWQPYRHSESDSIKPATLITQKIDLLPKRTTPKRPFSKIKTPINHDPRDYPLWISKYDTLTSKMLNHMQKCMKQWDYQPLISIVMPTYNTPEKWLRAAIESVQQQIYPHWELCIADDASTQPHVRHILEDYANKDPRIQIAFRTENGHISAASNSALELVTGEFVTFLDHDDLLARCALFWVVQDIIDYPNAMLWYSDEDKINEHNERYDPYFKSDWNPDLFLSHNLITHLAVYRMTLVQKIVGFRESFEGAQDYDFALRAIDQISPIQIRHIPRILYHWRAIQGSTAIRSEEKPYAIISAQKAISEYLGRRNIEATVTESPDILGTVRVQYHLPIHLPLVSLIIPTRNQLELLRRCIESIYDKTDYENFEILIINNNSDDPAILAYMQELQGEHKARIIDYPYPFNYADMNNTAVHQAQGELVGLLNNDLEVINREWLSEMVSHAVRLEIGVVGARLWYPNDTLQHGGVILGIGGVAGHSHKGLPRGDAGYFGRAGLIQNFSAVTGACMIMRKTNFLMVGGLDADNLSTAFNDVDLCLKMNEHNLRIVWTPYAELYHHESASRGYEDTPEKMARFEKERTYMKSRWPQFIQLDPAYSPNLTLETQDFAYSWPPRVPALI